MSTLQELTAGLEGLKIGSDEWALLSWRIRCLQYPESGPRFAGKPIAPLVERALEEVDVVALRQVAQAIRKHSDESTVGVGLQLTWAQAIERALPNQEEDNATD